MIRSPVIFLFCLLLCIACPSKASGYVKLNQLTTEDGLSVNNIIGLMQDNEGFIWISTNQGLSRFDGYRMSGLESPDDALSIQGSELVWQDSTGLIWLGSRGKNNLVLDHKTNSITAIDLPQPIDYKLEFPVFTKIVEDPQSNLWIATFGEIFYFERNHNQFQFAFSINELFPDPNLEHIIRDLLLTDSHLVIATSNGVYSYELKTKRISPINHLPFEAESDDQNNVKSLHLNQHQQLLIGTVEGLFQLDESLLGAPFDDQISRQLVRDRNIWQIIEKPNFYWLATDLGLFRLDSNAQLEQVFKLSDTPFSTSDDDLVAMIEDKEGNLWFGTKSDGIFKWRPNQGIKKHLWSKGQDDFKLNDDFVNSITKGSDNKVWVATNNGVAEIDINNWSTKNHLINPNEKSIESESSIYSIQENDGKLWVVSGVGVNVYNKKTMVKERMVFPKTEENLFTVAGIDLHFIDQNQMVIIGYKGMYEYNLATGKINFLENTANNGEYAEQIISFFDTPPTTSNQLFLSGINRLLTFSIDSKQTKVFHEITQSKQKDFIPADIYRDQDSLWVSYPGLGLFELDIYSGKELKFISESELGANSVMDIFSDNNGNLWLTSNDGLLRLNKQNLQVTKFDRNDGFASSEFNGGTEIRLNEEQVLLGSVKGMYIFEPDTMQRKFINPIKPLITGVSLLSSKIGAAHNKFNDKTIQIDYEDFGLNVSFSAMLFDKPRQVKYFYWITGDTKIDKTPVAESELFFPKFTAGESTLFISAVDYRNGLESPPAKLTIISLPAWWVSKKAFLAYALLFLLAGLISYRRYAAKQKSKEVIYKKIKLSEERLTLALQGSKSGMWDWHASEDLVYDPRLCPAESQASEKGIPLKNRFSAIHLKDKNKVMANWRDFLKTKNEVYESTYRMLDNNQQWHWYKDIAMISERDSQQNPIRVTGTYTNITEMQKAGEKTRLYSSAFENTLDIILILDRDRRITACNNALQKISGWNNQEILGKDLEQLIVSVHQKNITDTIFNNITSEHHWKGEAFLKNRRSKQVAILINATMFVDQDAEQYYVFSMSDISKQKEAESELKKLVNYDPLTNMPNRALLLDRISHAIPHCKRYDKKLAVFFVDLDRFKQVNDTLGHDAGDLLLKKSANILLDCCRDDDTVARIGGDEFVVMLENLENVSAINRILQNILQRMQEPMELGKNRVTISASIGVSIYPQDADNATALIKHADIAMYHAKNKGRNNFQYFQDFMNLAAKHRLSMENKIRAAVEENEFHLVYQPLFDIKSGDVLGVEALARWQTESGEFISPTSFIPLAEELGLIIPLTESLIRKALDSLTLWNANGNQLVLAFNISSAHIYHKGFIEFIDNLVAEYPNSIQYLEIELTESLLMEDIEKARAVFEKLEDYGIEVALDDFGTGYSSLKYLSRLPISKLKIDMSFVQSIGTNFENDAVIKTIISLAQSLKLKTVAEGIETAAQFDFLKQAKIDYAQGYLFSKPISASEFEKMLNQNIYQMEVLKGS